MKPPTASLLGIISPVLSTTKPSVIHAKTTRTALQKPPKPFSFHFPALIHQNASIQTQSVLLTDKPNQSPNGTTIPNVLAPGPLKPNRHFYIKDKDPFSQLLATARICSPPSLPPHKPADSGEAQHLYSSKILGRLQLCCSIITQTRPFYSAVINTSQFSTPPSLHHLCSSKTLQSLHLSCTKATQSRPFSSSTEDPPAVPPESMDSPSSTIPVVSTFTSPFENSPPPPSIDASASIRKPLSLWPGMYHSPVTNALWEARSSIFEKLLDPSKDGPPQSELLTKTPSQSRMSILYSFSSDYILREQYRDPWNEVRIGKLLEDLDALAGTIAVKHCSDDDSTTRPLLLVTASVDKMVLKKPIQVDTDLKIAGAVTWVGRSSIEIQMEVTQTPPQENSDPPDVIALTANFTFVARDSKTLRAATVNRLCPETEREKKLFEEGETRDKLRKRKKEERKWDFEKGAHILHGEVNRLKAMLTEGRIFCDMPALANRDSILMRDTRLENSLICQPQQRNLHGRIFGGFLMHRAFELAFSTAYAFVGYMPCFLEVDHVDFLKPVDVGDFLRFKSCVLYTQLENPMQPLINIEVEAHVTRPELRTSEVSNTFYFTFTVRPDALKIGLRIRNVVPATEEEARRVLERMDAEESYSCINGKVVP